jgi:D-alanyl-D-alanine carboxypeptidase
MLLNHTSGVPSYTKDVGFLARYFLLARKQWEPAELAKVIRNKPLRFEPGSQHEYSNSNYLLLGMILEQVTGQTYGALVKDLAGETLGLHHTHYRTDSDSVAIANAYDVTLLNLGTRNLMGFHRSLESGDSPLEGCCRLQKIWPCSSTDCSPARS